MPKPISERKTSNPLGVKINSVMREKGIEGDYGTLANIFGVKTPSVYDWITHGRLGKERYAKLVEWSGKSLDWWFDIPERTPYTYTKGGAAGIACTAAEEVRYFDTKPAPTRSPFPRISDAEWEQLPANVVREIETYAMGIIAGMRAEPELKRQNGA